MARLLPLGCGLAMLGSIIGLRRGGHVVGSAPLLLAACLLAVAGLGLVLTPMVRGIGRLVAGRAGGLAWRLGGARAAYEPRSIVRILAGLVALVVVGHLTFAVLADLRTAVGAGLDRVVASTSLDDPSAEGVDRLVAVAPGGVALVHTTPGDRRPASLAFVDCPTAERLLRGIVACRTGAAYRVAAQGFPSDLEPGGRYRFPRIGHRGLDAVAPIATAVDRFGTFTTDAIVVAGPRPRDVQVDEVRYVVDRPDLIDLEADVARVAPRAVVDTPIEPERIVAYDQQVAVARVGAAVGALLATLCFVVASVDRLLERRSHTAVLVAIGVPRRTLRASQVAQLLLPLVAALTAANAVGWLIGQAYLAAGGLEPHLRVDLLAQGVGVSLLALVAAIAVGAIVDVPADVAAHLHAE